MVWQCVSPKVAQQIASHCDTILGWNHVNREPGFWLACARHANGYVWFLWHLLFRTVSQLVSRRDLER
jgi:hypothetical protein